MNIKCMLGFHDMKVLSVNHYTDISWCRNDEQGAPSTSVVRKCSKCGKLHKESLYGYGFLTKEQLS